MVMSKQILVVTEITREQYHTAPDETHVVLGLDAPNGRIYWGRVDAQAANGTELLAQLQTRNAQLSTDLRAAQDAERRANARADGATAEAAALLSLPAPSAPVDTDTALLLKLATDTADKVEALLEAAGERTDDGLVAAVTRALSRAPSAPATAPDVARALELLNRARFAAPASDSWKDYADMLLTAVIDASEHLQAPVAQAAPVFDPSCDCRGGRRCLACNRIRWQRHVARQKDAAPNPNAAKEPGR
jgi:hypothetical protein